MAETTRLAPRVEDIVRNANCQFEDAVAEAEAGNFDATGLEEVKEAAREIERNLDDKGEMPNMARLRFFYDGAELPWFLSYRRAMNRKTFRAFDLPASQTSSEDSKAIKKLIGAIKEIGQAISSADLTEEAKEDDKSQEVLALIYDNVLELHRWRVFFDTSWARFERRLRRIRQEIAHLVSLLGQKEIGPKIDKARESHEEWRGQLDKQEKETSVSELNNVIFWLSADELDQEDELDFRSRQCHPQSCDWIYEHSKIKSWMQKGAEHSVLWLKGKPGTTVDLTDERSARAAVEAAITAFVRSEIKQNSVLCNADDIDEAVRPLKKFEIRDAITLRFDVSFINDSNRVRDFVFDYCKPLIEIGVDDTVRFIHVSVKDYLLKHHRLFTPEQAQGNITLSCLTYLISATNLIDPGHDETAKKMEVAKGYHGLCLYATRHFIEHFLTYLELVQPSAQSDFKDSLLQAADGLATQLAQFAPFKKPVIASDKLDQRCKVLSGREPLFSLVVSERVLRSRTSTRPQRDASAASEHGFTRIRSTYENFARQFLQADTLPDFDQRTLSSFKRIYGSSVLICRFSACPRGLHGFSTSTERDEHESTHRLDLLDPEASAIGGKEWPDGSMGLPPCDEEQEDEEPEDNDAVFGSSEKAAYDSIVGGDDFAHYWPAGLSSLKVEMRINRCLADPIMGSA
ncbi:hypothetical protein DV737_g5351, partial [Chaetothyriales sp. CBS 132003]